MKKLFVSILVLMMVSLGQLRAERHIFRASWSDATPLLVADLFVQGLSNSVTGAKSTGEDFNGMYTLGYRFKFSRLAIGADASYASLGHKVTLPGESFINPGEYSIKETGKFYLIMPALEFTYVKLPFVDFYTSMAAGYMYTELEKEGISDIGKSFLQNAEKGGGSSFAFQYNPIGIRAGIDNLAAFAELGFGFRGFICAGIDFRF